MVWCAHCWHDVHTTHVKPALPQCNCQVVQSSYPMNMSLAAVPCMQAEVPLILLCNAHLALAPAPDTLPPLDIYSTDWVQVPVNLGSSSNAPVPATCCRSTWPAIPAHARLQGICCTHCCLPAHWHTCVLTCHSTARGNHLQACC